MRLSENPAAGVWSAIWRLARSTRDRGDPPPKCGGMRCGLSKAITVSFHSLNPGPRTLPEAGPVRCSRVRRSIFTTRRGPQPFSRRLAGR
jgi:hypothetical protein